MQKLKIPKILLTSLAAVALLAAGCESKPNTLERPVDSTQQNSNNAETSQTENGNGEVAGQVAPLETKTITIANQEVMVEIANTDESRAQGLSGRANLEEGSGLLFDFTNSDYKKPGFWMKDMLISIDIIWISEGRIIGIEANAPLPPEDSDLPVYYPPSAITHVLEVPAGWSMKNNIVVGETVSL